VYSLCLLLFYLLVYYYTMGMPFLKKRERERQKQKETARERKEIHIMFWVESLKKRKQLRG